MDLPQLPRETSGELTGAQEKIKKGTLNWWVIVVLTSALGISVAWAAGQYGSGYSRAMSDCEFKTAQKDNTIDYQRARIKELEDENNSIYRQLSEYRKTTYKKLIITTKK